jgi:hypothetical protein
MTDNTPAGIRGYVKAFSLSFKNGEFRPFNAAYATFRPSDEVPEGNVEAILPPLKDGEFFQVRGDIDMSEGRGGTRGVGNYLRYEDAYRASFGKGAQGGIGEVWIMVPSEPSEITAIDADGFKVVMAVVPNFRMVSVSQRLIIPNPPSF